MSEVKTHYCLRCQHRFEAAHDPKKVAEKSCPACGSNSVRLETPAALAGRDNVRQATLDGGTR
ncbi:MAG: hypothetical protein OEM62_02920 [Acidobacteriota bacterium]|nr:hypothetical protein [Acidobacteriota bacterium]